MNNKKDLESIFNLINIISSSNKNNDIKNDNSNSNLDILSVLDVFMPKSNNNINDENEDENESILETNELQNIDNSANYIPYNNKKNILILIKLMEIKKLLKTYNNSNDNEKIDMHMFLNEIMPYINKDKQNDLTKYLELITLQKGFMNKWVE